MKTVSEIYPFSAGEVTEFTTMMQLPTEQDVINFASAASATADVHDVLRSCGAEADLPLNQASFWLPDGIVTLTSTYDCDDDIKGLNGIVVGLDVFKDVHNPAVSRQVEIILLDPPSKRGSLRLVASNGNDVVDSLGYPRLFDFGTGQPVDDPDYEIEATSASAGSRLDTSDVITLDEVAFARVSQATDPDTCYATATRCSQKTLRAVTSLLEDLR